MPAKTTPPPTRRPPEAVRGRPIAEFAVNDVVYLDRRASPQFAANPIRLMLTEPPAAAGIDYGGLRDLARARWVYLTGHELDRNGRRLTIRVVLASVAGILSLIPR